jgi:RHS repeat-associated protein
MFFTQHIYAGQTRIASKVNADSLNNPDTLWYHPDHIQSTQFVSAADQTLVQHFEYFASGETWKEESTDAVEPFRPAYAFNGKELDTKTGYYYFGARYYDPQVQNWQSTEPLLVKFVRGTPNDGLYKPANLAVYTYSGNNPVLFVDPNGETEVAFHMRSFAPFKSFGGGFNGDNRSFTTSTASSVTSRVRSRFEFDTSTGQLGGLSTVSDPSHFLGHFAKTAKPTGEAHVAASDLDTSTFELGANHAGSNPLVPGAPDIDLGADIKLHESKGALTITSLLHGNNFPNSELFVEDTAGNKVFLNAFETSAGRNTGPFFHLFGAGKERLGGQREIQIQLDDSGHFTGIIDKGKVIPLSEYNRLFKASHED